MINKYDQCVKNIIINSKQCNIVWHVHELKISLWKRCGGNKKIQKDSPLTASGGKVLLVDY